MANEVKRALKGASAKGEFADYAPFQAAVKERVHRSNLMPVQHDESAHARQA